MSGEGVLIGRRTVGGGRRPLILAELSGNHNGSLDGALRLIRAAAASGVEAIKLQTYTSATLTIDSERPEFFIDDPQSLWHGRRLWELYAEAHTPWEWHKPLFEAARAEGLLCISSAYDLSSLEFLLGLDVDAIKIASFEIVHIPLIEAAARSGKSIILSTGMATATEIDDAVGAMRRNGCERFVLLKCTSAYPSEEKDANIRTMLDMRTRYGCEVGLSDHTLRSHAAFAAAAHSAALIEKHFTIARAEGGVDSAFSIEPAELRDLVEGTGLVWQSLGEAAYGVRPAEETSLKERASIYVVRPMKKGERFTPENLRIIRPANGLAPKHYDAVIGKTCARDLAAEAPLTWELVTPEENSNV